MSLRTYNGTLKVHLAGGKQLWLFSCRAAIYCLWDIMSEVNNRMLNKIRHCSVVLFTGDKNIWVMTFLFNCFLSDWFRTWWFGHGRPLVDKSTVTPSCYSELSLKAGTISTAEEPQIPACPVAVCFPAQLLTKTRTFRCNIGGPLTLVGSVLSWLKAHDYQKAGYTLGNFPSFSSFNTRMMKKNI